MREPIPHQLPGSFLFALLCLAGCLLGIALWPGAVSNLTATSFVPHGYCYLWNPGLLTLHVSTDTTIWLSYLAISTTLALMIHRNRRDLPFSWIFVAFGVFIVFCGLTHAMDVVVLWKPYYWLAGDIKLITALASGATAIGLPFLLPKVRALFDEVRASRRNERRFLAAAESALDSFFILDSVRNVAGEIIDFRFAFVNENGARLLSQSPETLTGKLLCADFPDNRPASFFERYKRVVETGEPSEDEFQIDTPGINASWLRYQVVRLEDGVALTTSDVSRRRKAELDLVEASAFNHAILHCSPLATIVADLQGTITAFNPSAEQLLHYAKEEVLGRPEADILRILPESAGPAAVAFDAPRPLETEHVLLRKDGTRVPVQVCTSALTRDGSQEVGTVRVFSDITERKQAQDAITHMAHHDALTGLPNRVLLSDRLTHALKVAERESQSLAILMIDLDDFKQVNDTLGHRAGDALLVAVVERLRSVLRSADTLARMGGDEFVVLLEHLPDAADVITVAENLLGSLRPPIRIAGGPETGLGDPRDVGVGASIGISLYPQDGRTATELLIYADTAMYKAKAGGKNMYRLHGAGVGLVS